MLPNASEAAVSGDNVFRLWVRCPGPGADHVTPYDWDNVTLYGLLLEAELEGAEEGEIGRVFFGSVSRPKRSEVVRSHLARAHWLVDHGLFWLNW